MRSALLLPAALFLPSLVRAQSNATIENAMSAAPASIAAHATIVDHELKVLRAGTNGWTCMPDDPAVPNNSPMCLDQPWVEFLKALIGGTPPRIEGMGIGYMLQGDMPVSNIDPAAKGPTPTNQWIDNSGPHLMIVMPDPGALTPFSSNPTNGGPWVMWKGTPYAHLMVPLGPRPR